MSALYQAVVYLTLALPAVAQPQPFATITIKAARTADPRDAGVELLPSGDLIARAVPVVRLFNYAYDVPVNGSPRISPLPGWTVAERYDIEIKAPANAVPPSLQDHNEVRSRIQQMIRELLTDRFRLVIRVENKKVPVYALSVASGGPKLRKSDLSDKECTFSTPEACHHFAGGLGHPLNGEAVDMDDVVRYIENWTDLPVVNRTALSGLFALNTGGWFPMRLPPPPPNAVPATNPFAGLPTIFTVLGRLGLELNRQEEVLPVYTVEHLERPAVN